MDSRLPSLERTFTVAIATPRRLLDIGFYREPPQFADSPWFHAKNTPFLHWPRACICKSSSEERETLSCL